MDSEEERNDEFGDDLWGCGNPHTRACTDASDGSDFTPAQLQIMKSQTLDRTAPLPEGVRDIQWQPPKSTGLEHSVPIFETETDAAGGLRMTSLGLSGNNCHFRSWQEDNGVASTFASETVVKDVDGEQRMVSIGSTAAATSSFFSPRNTSVSSHTSALAHLREVKRLSLRSTDSTDSSKVSKDDDGPVLEGAASASSSPQQPSPALRRPSTGTPTPRRPSDSPPSSSRARPGRSLSPKKDVEGMGTSSSSKQQEAAEATRPPSPTTATGGEGEPTAVVNDEGGGVGSGDGSMEDIAPANSGESAVLVDAGAEIEDGIVEEVTPTHGGQGDQQHQEADKTAGPVETKLLLLHSASASPSPSTSPKADGKEKARKTWWGGLRTPKAPSQPPTQEAIRQKAASSPDGGDAAPEGRRWPSFRRNKAKTIVSR